MIPIPVSPIMRAFAVIGSERTAIDSMMRLYGLTKAEARLLVRTVRANEQIEWLNSAVAAAVSAPHAAAAAENNP